MIPLLNQSTATHIATILLHIVALPRTDVPRYAKRHHSTTRPPGHTPHTITPLMVTPSRSHQGRAGRTHSAKLKRAAISLAKTAASVSTLLNPNKGAGGGTAHTTGHSFEQRATARWLVEWRQAVPASTHLGLSQSVHTFGHDPDAREITAQTVQLAVLRGAKPPAVTTCFLAAISSGLSHHPT